MTMMMKIISLIIATFSLLFIGQFVLAEDDQQQPPIVTIKNGKVRGYTKTLLYEKRKLFVYEGIPYGKPPVGELRFKPSQPIDNWNGIYDAHGYRNACMHSNLIKPDNEFPETKHQSEDCLFLSVFRPATETQKKLPVMYWIHGGGFETGTIFSFVYDPSYLSGIGDVIVVTVNYRLGTFGFMYADDEEAPGNAGLYDQILGLKWTRDNIEQFGGDPDQITIFGQSAGGMSVSALLLSPLTKGLFKRAIMQSGAVNSWMGSNNKNEALKKTKLIANALKCPNDDIKQMVKCIRNASANDIVNANQYGRNIGMVLSPVYGSELLPKNPVEALKNGDFHREVDLMFGVTRNEGSVFAEVIFPKFLSPTIKNPQFTRIQAQTLIELLFGVFKAKDPKTIAEFYVKNISDSDVDGLRNSVNSAFGDYHLICPSIFFGETFASHSESNNVYGYHLVHKPTISAIVECVGYMGVCHGDDLVYLFGFPIELRGIGYSEDDFYQSMDMIKAWSNFAHNGQPGKFGNIEWQPTLKKHSSLSSNSSATVLQMDVRGKHRMVDNYFVPFCENFWRQRIFV
ncbi:cholinesterase [Dermatophagoides farinae]|uniref:Carboxylic ester hydrolase n=1 Tax=Dermatophagoides farinae TaxID=6954 RepID=A0A922IEF0_DERFA|nr:cholinesterase 1-like [Dermatophagoides farinae]KAH7641350.1 acetylcholinesterase-like protein [Dermatophagoides farinae]KAH9527118.1 hypothetical protein DERF_001161 [Dermatophagoides farinae]